jgi:diaminobutyrate-2-oxoglutarate transaminase
MKPALKRDRPAAVSIVRTDVSVFERIESNVRTYSRSFPTVFEYGKDAMLFDEAGKEYIDFFAGAGALNYGHNPDFIKPLLIDYLQQDRIIHGLDMFTSAKQAFLASFENNILAPRDLDYKVQFCGPTGANAVEAALKLARLVTGRPTIAAFSGGWHGMSNACLSVTGNRAHRASAGAPLANAIFLPFQEGPSPLAESLGYIEGLFEDPNSGLDLPAALILETVQAEGGIYLASSDWLRGIRALCDRWGVLLIVDDIQVGCGRTGSFFSFEEAGITPDIVCLSKSISGYGLPMSLVLMRRHLDQWKPGQHTGTFRGNQLAFVAAKAALELWTNESFIQGLRHRSALLEAELHAIAANRPGVSLRGRGFIWGLDFTAAGGPEAAKAAAQAAFQDGLIIERCGRDDVVLKILPPITIDPDTLQRGCSILNDVVRATS